MFSMGSGDTRCPRCDAALPADARFCPACGYAATRLSEGDVLDGKYEILGKLGEGGMGEVYRARHIHLDEIRVIKVTKPDSSGPGNEPRRFQEEARLATLVRHPNVAALYDFSRLPDGSFYMVWEYIDGVTLEEWLRRHGPLTAAETIDVASQILSGLSEIHAQGIVHRDLSPDNILLRKGADGRLQAKIIDLGIAKRIASESLARTGTGMFLGKLKYCSPEQAGTLPRGASLDPRSDLYSFGVVLYEMVAGRAPFEASTPEGYLGQHLHAPPPPLDVSTLPSGLGRDFAAIVTRALEKNRERRFRDASEFRTALQALRPAPMPGENPSFGARDRAVRTAAVAVAVLVILAAGLVLLGRGRGGSPGHVAAPFEATPPEASATPTPIAPPPEVAGAPPTAGPDAAELPPSRASSRGVVDPSEAGTASTPAAARPLEASPTPAAASGEAPPEVPLRMDEEGAQRFHRFWKRWRTFPPERQSVESRTAARLANRFVSAYPDDPLAGELRRDLPGILAGGARRELGAGHPRIAARYYHAYRELESAPADADLDRLFAGVRAAPE